MDNRTLIEPIMPTWARGKLFIIGGHEDKDGNMEILSRFAEAAGGKNARIAVITTASEVPDEIDEMYRPVFEGLGVKQYAAIKAQTREDAYEPANIDLVCQASGILISGGKQLRLTSMIGGTPICAAVKERYLQGACVAGTSAGAAALSDTIILHSPSSKMTQRESVTLGPGLGLLRDILIDQHFNERDRLYDLLSALALNPAKLGIGIDEDTALIVTPDAVGEVVGSGVVTLTDGRNIKFSDLPEVSTREMITLSGIVLHVVTPGYKFDLQNRTLLPK